MRQILENLHLEYNCRKYVEPDPLQFLYGYSDIRDREIAALIASSFAYGRVSQINKTLEHIFSKTGPALLEYVTTRSRKEMVHDFDGFVYRFARTTHLVSLLCELQQVVNRFGAIEAVFHQGIKAAGNDADAFDALRFFYDQLEHPEAVGHLLADPFKNSACKRSHLMLRWLARKDDVDPGGWDAIDQGRLVIPLDTHMFAVGRMLGFTSRNTMDFRTAKQITEGFAAICPEDPVRYDFCLTRFGIRNALDMDQLKDIITGKREVA